MLRLACSIWLLAAFNCAAQEMTPSTGGGDGSNWNQEFLRSRPVRSKPVTPMSAAGDNGIAVFGGDRLIPQFVDGGYWQTSVTTVNLESHNTSFDILFFQDDGTDFMAPVVGMGPVRSVHIALSPLASATFQTEGTAMFVTTGWALLSQPNNDAIGVFAVFRQTAPGRQPQEAVVPAVSQSENHFVMPFDNTGFITGIALANPTLNIVNFPVNIRDEKGQIIDTRNFSLGPSSHTSFSLPDTWGTTAGRRGTIEFITSGFGLGALGLRFNGAAFTSLNVMQNSSWTQ
jgi:hypothetical protein